jgi:nitroimidazol reductase NimA-like FMN-containing flavoprotein (pyridoxamine 5'-phosphate oxidase superfamily)
MRRTAQEIKNKEMIEQVIANAQVCRLGLSKDNVPYVVPVSFGYDGARIYFHTAPLGMKLDYIASNPRVCFEFEDQVKMLPHATDASQWSVSYFSVIGFGRVAEILNREEKVKAVDHIMAHYSDQAWSLDEVQLGKARVWGIAIETMTGKKSKDKIAV